MCWQRRHTPFDYARHPRGRETCLHQGLCRLRKETGGLGNWLACRLARGAWASEEPFLMFSAKRLRHLAILLVRESQNVLYHANLKHLNSNKLIVELISPLWIGHSSTVSKSTVGPELGSSWYRRPNKHILRGNWCITMGCLLVNFFREQWMKSTCAMRTKRTLLIILDNCRTMKKVVKLMWSIKTWCWDPRVWRWWSGSVMEEMLLLKRHLLFLRIPVKVIRYRGSRKMCEMHRIVQAWKVGWTRSCFCNI